MRYMLEVEDDNLVYFLSAKNPHFPEHLRESRSVYSGSAGGRRGVGGEINVYCH